MLLNKHYNIKCDNIYQIGHLINITISSVVVYIKFFT